MFAFIPAMAETAQKDEEDRLLAALIQQDREGRYEYKILHAGFRTFRKPERMREILDQEARSQWELALKLDDQRLVLRRPRDERSRDAFREPGTDPYRTELSSVRSTALITVILGVVIVGVLAFVLFSQQSDAPTVEGATPVIWILLGVFALVFLLVIVRRRTR